MRHLMIIDPVSQLNLELDSSIRLARSFESKGHEVLFTQIEDLYSDSNREGSSAVAFSMDLAEGKASVRQGSGSSVELDSFDSIHMRKEPPFNLSYISACWILARNSKKVYNQPEILMSMNEKLSIFHFPDFADKAIVGQNPDQILEFTARHGIEDLIAKPLDLYGGRGVERLQWQSDSELIENLKKMLTDGPRIFQPFNHSIFDGEIRAFGFGQETLSWCLKRPPKGSFFANTREGAQLEPFTPSKELSQKVSEMGKKLFGMGAKIWGVDIIGDKLSEINITSPRMLTIGEDQTRSGYEKLAECIETDALA